MKLIQIWSYKFVCLCLCEYDTYVRTYEIQQNDAIYIWFNPPVYSTTLTGVQSGLPPSLQRQKRLRFIPLVSFIEDIAESFYNPRSFVIFYFIRLHDSTGSVVFSTASTLLSQGYRLWPKNPHQISINGSMSLFPQFCLSSHGCLTLLEFTGPTLERKNIPNQMKYLFF